MPATRTKMTAADIALMREIVRWRRNHGVTYWRSTRPLGNFAVWSDGPRWGADNQREVAVDFKRGDDGRYLEMTVGTKGELGGLVIDDRWSLTQAVDLLCALRYLPPRFSSAYRAGWHASLIWETGYQLNGTDPDGTEFVRLFHDPANISFPAVPE